MNNGLEEITVTPAANGFTLSKRYRGKKNKDGYSPYQEPERMVFNDPYALLAAIGECIGVKTSKKGANGKMPIWERNAMKHEVTYPPAKAGGFNPVP